MYDLYGAVMSRAFRPLWLLEELGCDFTHIDAAPRAPEVRAIHPSGKVPVLVADGVVIPDSVAIMHFLADRHGQFTCPAGSLDRGRQDALTFRILDEVDALLWTAARHSFVLPEAERVPEIKPSLRAEFARNTEALASALTGPWLMGDAFTVPDILLAHCAGWAGRAGFPDLPAPLADHAARAQARPAFQRARQRAVKG